MTNPQPDPFDVVKKGLDFMRRNPDVAAAITKIRETLEQSAVKAKDDKPVDKVRWSDVTDDPHRGAARNLPDSDVFELRVTGLVRQITYKENYRLILERDKMDPQGRLYLQVECARPDINTREMGIGRGGKAYLSEYMTDGEIIRKAFGLFMAYEEHECREFFQWRGRSVFGPHISVSSLWDVADQLEYRD